MQRAMRSGSGRCLRVLAVLGLVVAPVAAWASPAHAAHTVAWGPNGSCTPAGSASVQAGSSLGFSVCVQWGGGPWAGHTLTATLTAPDGTTTNTGLVTDGAGRASWTRQPPAAGTYTERVCDADGCVYGSTTVNATAPPESTPAPAPAPASTPAPAAAPPAENPAPAPTPDPGAYEPPAPTPVAAPQTARTRRAARASRAPVVAPAPAPQPTGLASVLDAAGFERAAWSGPGTPVFVTPAPAPPPFGAEPASASEGGGWTWTDWDDPGAWLFLFGGAAALGGVVMLGGRLRAPNEPLGYWAMDPLATHPMGPGFVDPGTNLQQAIDGAAPGSTFILLPGEYPPFTVTTPGVTIQSTDPNDPAVVGSTVIRGDGTGPAVTIGTPGERSDGLVVVLDGLTITGGGGPVGGGITACWGSAPQIVNSVVSDNRVSHGGGGIALLGTVGATVVDSTITGNGAGTHGGGLLSFLGTGTTVQDSTFSGNAALGNGAGIFHLGALEMLSPNVYGGLPDGSGVRLAAVPAVEGWLTLDRVVLLDNVAGGGGGGAAITVSKVRIRGCTFEHNVAGARLHGDGPGSSHRDGPLVDFDRLGGETLNDLFLFPGTPGPGDPVLDGGGLWVTPTSSVVSEAGRFDMWRREVLGTIDAPAPWDGVLFDPSLGSPFAGPFAGPPVTVTVSGGVFDHNAAVGNGGAIAAGGVGGPGQVPHDLVVEGSVFTENRAGAAHHRPGVGGAVWCDGDAWRAGDVEATNHFSGNVPDAVVGTPAGTPAAPAPAAADEAPGSPPPLAPVAQAVIATNGERAPAAPAPTRPRRRHGPGEGGRPTTISPEARSTITGAQAGAQEAGLRIAGLSETTGITEVLVGDREAPVRLGEQVELTVRLGADGKPLPPDKGPATSLLFIRVGPTSTGGTRPRVVWKAYVSVIDVASGRVVRVGKSGPTNEEIEELQAGRAPHEYGNDPEYQNARDDRESTSAHDAVADALSGIVSGGTVPVPPPRRPSRPPVGSDEWYLEYTRSATGDPTFTPGPLLSTPFDGEAVGLEP